MNLDQYPDVLTLHECQQILQVSRGTMLRLLHENEIPAFRVGNRWRIQRKAMLEFIGVTNTENNRNEQFRLGIPIRNAWKSSRLSRFWSFGTSRNFNRLKREILF